MTERERGQKKSCRTSKIHHFPIFFSVFVMSRYRRSGKFIMYCKGLRDIHFLDQGFATHLDKRLSNLYMKHCTETWKEG